MECTVPAERAPLKEVVVYRPGIEKFFGLMAPFPFLYERAFSMDEAIHEHRELERSLASAGVKVHRLKRLAVSLARENADPPERAREYAVRIVKFAGPTEVAKKARREFEESLTGLDAETVFNILLLRPSLKLEGGKGGRRTSLPVATRSCFRRPGRTAHSSGNRVSSSLTRGSSRPSASRRPPYHSGR